MVDKIGDKGISINFIDPKLKDHNNTSFLKLLKNYLKDVDISQHKADKAVNEFLAGNRGIHEVMIAVEKADISFRLFMKIRNKLIEAYQEIMRMQV